jgi:arabinogalactan endo-1,4-beta-galactosidase
VNNIIICKIIKKVKEWWLIMSENFAYGVDLGWLSQLEAQGVYWIDDENNKTDPIELLKNMGANAVRLRVFVNPPRDAYWQKPKKECYGNVIGGEDCMLGFCDKDSVLEMSKRVKEHGMRLMIDIHYSDHFADPIFQDIPKEWENDDVAGLIKRVEGHTKEVIGLLADNNIFPEWVQVGNEINTGILLPMGSSKNNPDNLIAFLNSGYKAVKECSPESLVVTHIAGGHDYDVCKKFFDMFFEKGGLTDIMGFSYYPYWMRIEHNADRLKNIMTKLSEKYKKPLLLSEIGAREDEEDESYEFLLSSVRAIKDLPNQMGQGVFWWEPEVGADLLPDHYILGAARVVKDKSIRFTKAINAYKDSL